MAICSQCGRETSTVAGTCEHCGRLTVGPSKNDRLLDEIQALLAAGQKIAAVKLFKDSFQVSLAEAKQAVDELGANAAVQKPLAHPQPESVRELLQLGRKLEAIKVHREQNNCGLREAKEQVDALEARENLRPALAKGGCSGVFLSWLILVTGAAIVALGIRR